MNEEIRSTINDIVHIIDNKNFSEEDKVNLLLMLFEKIMNEDMAEYIVGGSNKDKNLKMVRNPSYGVPLDILYGVIYEED